MSARHDTSSPAQSSRQETPQQPARDTVWRMFDRIAPRYDLLNRLLSGGRDVAWRKRLARHLPPGEGLCVLDLATGTADVLIMLDQASERVGSGLGVDM
ncbi:MAG: class I SAM-dependent methyltransferase, partial [Candidatus Hydrogenedentota bacterium]